jgi:glycosyltransferase involved in cell wall biosynthesis
MIGNRRPGLALTAQLLILPSKMTHRSPESQVDGMAGRHFGINVSDQNVMKGMVAQHKRVGSVSSHSDSRQALFVQVTEPAAYPPLINASILMADRGWNITFLSAPTVDDSLVLALHPGIAVERISERPTYVVTKLAYFEYCRRAIGLALRLQPKLVYASDPIGALPGLLASRAGGSDHLIYHEHDTPNQSSDLNPIIRLARTTAIRTAKQVIFPHAQRAAIVGRDPNSERFHVVWNTPRLAELPAIHNRPEQPLVVYYHGSISATRIPKTVAEAVARLGSCARIRIAGYETENGYGYIDELKSLFGDAKSGGIIDYVGQVPRDRLLVEAARAHIGLALTPMVTNDLNMRYMAGASNKAFDYMAAGLPFLVSDLPEWRAMFADADYAVACDPRSADSVEAALRPLAASPLLRKSMGYQARKKVEQAWNYDAQFANVLAAIQSER